MNKLIWEGSHFENATTIWNLDGSKLATNKSKIRDAIKAIFGHIPKAVNSDKDQKFATGEKEWYRFQLHTFTNAMISYNRDQCFQGTQLHSTLEYRKLLGDVVLLGFRKENLLP